MKEHFQTGCNYGIGYGDRSRSGLPCTTYRKTGCGGHGCPYFVTQPGTKNAETCLAYCPPNEIVPTDEQVDLGKFTLFLDHNSVPFLEEAFVDYSKDQMGGQLTIKAPNAKVPNVDENAPLPDRIQYILASEINPNLAAHGGEVSLVEVAEESIAVLRFGGVARVAAR